MKLFDVRTKEGLHRVLLGIIIVFALWTAINPFDSYMWRANFMVAVAYTIGFVIIYRRVKFSTLTVVLVFIHLVIILLAAKYTYEEFPPFNWLRDNYNLDRNYFDRVGHFFQGFAPVIAMREIYLKSNYMKKSKFFYVTLVMFTLGISGAWELLEFVGSEVAGKTEVYTLSMQGDIWDAQRDMLICTVAAITSLLIFSKYHDTLIEKE